MLPQFGVNSCYPLLMLSPLCWSPSGLPNTQPRGLPDPALEDLPILVGGWTALSIPGMFPALGSSSIPAPTRFRVLRYGYPSHTNSYASFKALAQLSLSSGSPLGLFMMCFGDIGHVWVRASPLLRGPQAIIPTGAPDDTHWTLLACTGEG